MEAHSLSEAFKPLTLAEALQLGEFLRNSRERSCEFSIANLYLWSFSYHIRWQIFQGHLYLHVENPEEPEDAMMVVTPEGAAEPTAEELLEFSVAMQTAGFSGQFQQIRGEFVQNCPDLSNFYQVSPMSEEVSEYIYRVEDLAHLRGEKYSKKRNLIKQFWRNHPGAIVRELVEGDLPLVLRMTETWLSVHPDGQSRHLQEEWKALSHLQDAPFAYFDLLGYGLFWEGDLLGFIFLSPIAGGMWTEHFEKALPGHNGAAQALNQEAVKGLLGKCEWLNREQDLGAPGLRQAKRSYHPAYLLRNYDLFPKGQETI